MMKQILLPSLLMALMSFPATAGEMSVAEKLEMRKQEFSKKADPQKLADYDEGVRLVAQSGVLEHARKRGEVAPDFTLMNATGEKVTLSNVLASGPVVLIWYRGEWCPYCNIYLEDIQKHMPEFKAAGAQVIAISPEKPDGGWTMKDKLGLDFYVLSDPQGKVAADYGVLYTLPPKIAGYLQQAFDLHGKNGDESNVLPLGASYVINQDGRIAYSFIDPDYRKRAETRTLLQEVKALRPQYNE